MEDPGGLGLPRTQNLSCIQACSLISRSGNKVGTELKGLTGIKDGGQRFRYCEGVPRTGGSFCE